MQSYKVFISFVKTAPNRKNKSHCPYLSQLSVTSFQSVGVVSDTVVSPSWNKLLNKCKVQRKWDMHTWQSKIQQTLWIPLLFSFYFNFFKELTSGEIPNTLKLQAFILCGPWTAYYDPMDYFKYKLHYVESQTFLCGGVTVSWELEEPEVEPLYVGMYGGGDRGDPRMLL